MAFQFFARGAAKAGKSAGKHTWKVIWELGRVGFFVSLFMSTRRFLFRLAWLSVKIGVFLYLLQQAVNLVESLFSSFAVSPPPELSQGISMVVPHNFTACFTAILTTKFIFLVLSIKDNIISSA